MRTGIIKAICFSAVLAAVSGAQAGTPIRGQLGVLDLSANGGLNPATGAPWAVGDKYRLVFVSSEFYDGTTSTNIGDYNAFIQATADASSLVLGAATWKAIGSTATVDARDNTATNPNEDGTGEPLFRMDGVTLVATNYVDLWDGTLVNAIRNDENNAPFRTDGAWGTWGGTWTGSDTDGTGRNGMELGSGYDTEFGLADTAAGAWINRNSNIDTTNALVYGLSEPLTVLGTVGSYVEFE